MTAGRLEPLTARIGAVCLLLAIIVLVITYALHPGHEDPMDNPAVFREYAQSEVWIADHLGQWLGFLLVIGGLIAISYSLGTPLDAGAAVARYGRAAAVTTGASFTILQAVDGIALKRAVDAWVSAPPEQEVAAFAAAEAIRWIEIGVNALSFSLAGLTLLLLGLAIALSSVYPRWVGAIAVAAGVGNLIRGLETSSQGFVFSIVALVGLVLLVGWALIMAVLLWRGSHQPTVAD